MANNNDSLLIQIGSLLQNTSGGGGGGNVTVNNFPADYTLEATQQDLLTALQSLVTNTTGPLSVTETNPITGFNLEATQQNVLLELQKHKDIETTVFIDSNETPGASNYIVFRDSIYDTTSATYVDNYYKIDSLGVKIPFDAELSAGISPIDTRVIAQLELITQAVTASPVSFVDSSGTIAAANTSQQILASNSNRNYLLIQNVSDTDMWINFNSAATTGGGSIKLVPNGSYELVRTSGGRMTNQSINIICSVVGKEFTAKEA